MGACTSLPEVLEHLYKKLIGKFSDLQRETPTTANTILEDPLVVRWLESSAKPIPRFPLRVKYMVLKRICAGRLSDDEVVELTVRILEPLFLSR